MIAIRIDKAPCKKHGSARSLAAAIALGASLTAAGALADDRPSPSITSADGTVRFNVLSLKRSEGDTVTLRIEVVNDGQRDYSMTDGNIKLIDLVGRQSYGAGLSSDKCNTPGGKRLTCWAIFAAPPTATKTMAVKLYEQMDMIVGVPVTE